MTLMSLVERVGSVAIVIAKLEGKVIGDVCFRLVAVCSKIMRYGVYN